MQILVATTNRHKLREIEQVLSNPALTLISMDELASPPEVIEDKDTFEGNAVKKAVELARFSGMWTLADDSGLEVGALNGAPGVHSARYAGEPVNYRANNAKLVKELAGCADRSARFVCVIALSDPEGNCRTVRGTVEGTIIEEGRGDNGFGYDPLFVPAGHNITFAEMSDHDKNIISHRANALAAAVSEWADLLQLSEGQAEDDLTEYVKICELKDEIFARRVGEELTEKGIPHVIRSFRDSAYDGIFQTTMGWGHVEAPVDRSTEISQVVSALESEN